MPASAEDRTGLARATDVPTSVPFASTNGTAAGSANGHGRPATNGHVRAGSSVDDGPDVLLDAKDDKWHWRRKIRRNPRQLAVYRVGVGLVGLFLILAGLATGWIPGPGGIPLILLGLAVWSSEFHWAHRLMQSFKAYLKRYTEWSRRKQVLFWILFFTACGMCGYSYMLLLGVPGWLPNSVEYVLGYLPGV